MSKKYHSEYDKPGAPEEFDAVHFGGPIGEFFLNTQKQMLLKLLNIEKATILDVGTGTGRIAIPLAIRGADVVAIDASSEMLRRAQQKAGNIPNLRFQVANARQLPFSSRSFDYVLSFRTLMHFSDWPNIISEMCRVSRRFIIFDAPPTIGAPILEVLFDRTRQLWCPEIQPYKTFFVWELTRELAKHDFKPVAIQKQLILPFKLHRGINQLGFTTVSEAILQKIGLRKLFGAPILMKAVRIK